MKSISAIQIIIMICAAWPCFAGYDVMKQELAAYRPEHSAAIRSMPPDTGGQAAVSVGTGLTEDQAFIQTLVQAHEKKSSDPGPWPSPWGWMNPSWLRYRQNRRIRQPWPPL